MINNGIEGALHEGCTEIAEIAPMEPTDNPPASDSKESTSRRGGKRLGAGRKPNPTRLLKGVSKETLAAAVANIDVAEVVVGLLRSKKDLIRLQTLNFVYDRMLGKPKQDVSVSGGFVHAHTRDPFLASLPQEGLEALARSYDEVLAKYIPNASQNGPQIQKESKPARLLEQMEP